MTMRFYVPGDAGAVAIGADDVARALREVAQARGIDFRIGKGEAAYLRTSNWNGLMLPLFDPTPFAMPERRSCCTLITGRSSIPAPAAIHS